MSRELAAMVLAMVGLAALGAGGDAPGGTPVFGDTDEFAPWESEDGCSGVVLPGTRLFREFILSQWGEKAGSPENIMRACSIGGDSGHKIGRAWDWMIPSTSAAQECLELLSVNGHEIARRAGLMYMIYNGRIWRSYSRGSLLPGEWSDYDGPSAHTEHIHFSLGSRGANGLTSLYTANA